MAFCCHTYNRVFGANIVGISRPRASGALTAGQCCRAYEMPLGILPNLPSVPVAFISLGGALSQSDVNRTYGLDGLSVPTVQKHFVDGATEVPDSSGADVENHLDVILGVPLARATGKAPALGVIFAPNSDTGIPNAIRAAVDLGYKIITISWGNARKFWTPQALAALDAAIAYAHSKLCWVFASSGDSSQDDGTGTKTVDLPGALCYPVGGTYLALNADGSIATERAWGDGLPGDAGGGGGYDSAQHIPPWQVGVVPGTQLGTPFSSANADPASGYRIFSGGSELSVGGTSGSNPLTGGMFAVIYAQMLAAGIPIPPDPAPLFFPKGSLLWNDIILGSNGEAARIGFDTATGLGSFNYPKLSAFMLGNGGTVPIPPTPPVPVPPIPTPPPTGPTLPKVIAADENVFNRLRSSFRRVPGATPVLNSGLADLEKQHTALYVGAHDIEAEAVEPYSTERVSL